MGACATKPGDLKDEGEAPLPLPAEEKEPAAEGVSDDVKLEEKEDESKRTSLSHLFRESEKRREASENDEEVLVKETITTTQVETKGEKEEQTKAQVHPTRDVEVAETVEPKDVSAPTHEEASVPPSMPISEAPVAEEKPVEVVSVKEVVSAPIHEETSIPSIPISEAPVAEEKPVEVESVKEVVSAPTHKETSVPPSIPISEAHVAEEKPAEFVSLKEVAEDSNTGDVEQKTTVVEGKGHATTT